MGSRGDIPTLAAGPGYNGPKRSLILSGGGIRVAYQAGALRALEEAGLVFTHMDATSGGAINLAMILSGLSTREMCDRWRNLDLSKLISLMPLRDYLKVSGAVALGDADGFRKHGFAHLGIDLERINSVTALEATFNVLNFSKKVNEVIPSQEMDLDLLVAGMSLPGIFPPVRRGNDLYLDSAFVRDANLMEGVRRSSQELWLIWCLGNTTEYRGGAFQIYLQMLEMSANGSLHDELDHIREHNKRLHEAGQSRNGDGPVQLHLVKSEYPLPPDPELFLGGIDLGTLVDMGYADTKRYLDHKPSRGLPLQPEVTRMKSESLGLTFRETMSGGFAMGVEEPNAGKEKGAQDGTELGLHATVRIRDIERFIEDPEHIGSLTGHIDFEAFGTAIPGKAGVFNLFSPSDQTDTKLMIYELGFEFEGRDYYLAGRKEVRDDPGFDLWADTTTLFTRLHEGVDSSGDVVGAGVLRLGVSELTNLVSTMRVTNAESATQSASVLAKFARFFLGELWDSYASLAPGGRKGE